MAIKIFRLKFLWLFISVFSLYSCRGTDNSPEFDTHPHLIYKTLFGDVDGDGLEDIVQFAHNKIFAMRNNAERDGILNKYLDSNIKRLILGTFATTGNEHEKKQIVAIMDDNSLRAYFSSDDSRTLHEWIVQNNFIADEEKPLVGDFDGNGTEDILVYNPILETLRLYTLSPLAPNFHEVENFNSATFNAFNLKRKMFYVGEFGANTNQTDLLMYDPESSQLSRFDSRIDENEEIVFDLKFTTETGLFPDRHFLLVGNLEGGDRDGVIMSRENSYHFFRAEIEGGGLERIVNLSNGDLGLHRNVTPVIGNFSGFDSEEGGKREDIVLYNKGRDKFVMVDARYDFDLDRFTFRESFSSSFPTYNEGWNEIQRDKWLIVKCNFNDDITTIPQNIEYYDELFTQLGEAKWGMYNYLLNLSYGGLILDAEVTPNWATVPYTLDNAGENGLKFRLSGPIAEGHDRAYYFNIESQEGNEVYLRHPYTGKYIYSPESVNGSEFETRFPLIVGDEDFYTFEMLPVGEEEDEYMLKHKHSGKYLGSIERDGVNIVWMWAPIPDELQERYIFQFISQGRDDNGVERFYIKHKFTGKYIRKDRNRGRLDLTGWCVDAHSYSDLTPYKGIFSIYNKGFYAPGAGIDGGNHGNTVNLHMESWHQNVIAHEMMHVYGLRHSYDDNDREYVDPFDVEGSSPDSGRFSGDFASYGIDPARSSGPGIHAINKQKLGWIPENRIQVLEDDFTESIEVQIAALNRPESNGFLSLIIKLSEDEEIGVELREDRDWDQAFGRTAIYIRKHDSHLPFDDNKRTFLQTMGSGPQFMEGEIYTDSEVSIEVMEIDTSKGIARVVIRRL